MGNQQQPKDESAFTFSGQVMEARPNQWNGSLTGHWTKIAQYGRTVTFMIPTSVGTPVPGQHVTLTGSIDMAKNGGGTCKVSQMVTSTPSRQSA